MRPVCALCLMPLLSLNAAFQRQCSAAGLGGMPLAAKMATMRNNASTTTAVTMTAAIMTAVTMTAMAATETEAMAATETEAMATTETA